ncbi:MAG TPA: hypothetical protein VKX16_15420, partial [Chloroflexota bacterium]|nr:hypothetical protein [Chloroflexota bacterium]
MEMSVAVPTPRVSQDAESESHPSELYRVVRSDTGGLIVELTDAGLLERLRAAVPAPPTPNDRDHLSFLAERRQDGTYCVALTEAGIQQFETALGLAADFGRHRTVSHHSTIADLMERAATREELSDALRSPAAGNVHRARVAVLRRKLRGTEEPSFEDRTVSRAGKLVIVAAALLWALWQLRIALQDIQDIPGILANLPGDILALTPTRPFEQVGSNISDAGAHLMLTGLGIVVVYVAAKMINPLGRMYRRDQLVPGERTVVRLACWILRRIA